MVNTFTIKGDIVHGTAQTRLTDEFFKSIRDRTNECKVPRCWLLKDPKDKGDVYLPRQYFNEHKGRYCQIRQVLFQLVYQEPAPIGRTINMACGDKRCVNPMHMKVTGWQPPWGIIEKYIGVWITRSQAEQFYGVHK